MPRDARMARLGRIVAAGFPHHVTQRSNRRQTIFFEPADDALYRGLLAKRRRKARREKRVTGRCPPNSSSTRSAATRAAELRV
jgi:hypothetical protein